MKNKPNPQDSLNRLKPAAERTILQDVEVNPELESRILAAIALREQQTARAEGSGAVQSGPSRGVARLVALLLVMVGALTAFGLLHSEHRATQTLSGAEIIFTITPLAAVSAGFLRDSLRLEPAYRNASGTLENVPGF